ncbi:hypothetical protein EI555_016763 [Monodon monoceros]|uniref:Dehydrogenase/reductase SDR family member 11 n=1 Tax=Monodon monoceros TaxID=40151 RepID=A0A4V5P9Y0_MONMO|nr:hypothetical protein EI555_016763 [Monodon monoceros]
MWPFAEQRRVEPGAEAGQSGGRSRRSPDWARSGAVAAVVTREWPGPYDPGQSSAIQVLGSPGEVGGRLGTLARAGMERWRDRLALVTGASGGVGAAVARALVQQGLKVVGRARTVSNIEELAAECKSAGYPGTLTPYRCDLSNEEDILSMFSAVRSQHSGVDICINNAGLARPDTLLSGSTGGWKDMFNRRERRPAESFIAACPRGLKGGTGKAQRLVGSGLCFGCHRPPPNRRVLCGSITCSEGPKLETPHCPSGLRVNVLALSICPRGASQSMRERKVDDGHTININSMSGHQVPPQSVAHFYSATKYAVTALTEGLRQELREAQTHIRATCISPGVVETQFAFKLQDKDPEKAAATYEHMKCLKPEDVAKAVIYVLSTPPHVQIGDIQMRPTEQVT